MRGLNRFCGAVVALGLLAALAACASQARSTALVAPLTTQTIVTESNPLFRRVVLGTVAGGKKTTLISASQVSNANFREALNTSLDLTLLKGADATRTDNFVLDAVIEQIEQPSLQINVTVTATIRYMLRRPGGPTLFEQRLVTPFTAQFTDTFIRQERFRLASEGAVKANIREFLNQLIAASNADPYRFL